jgi:ABC-type nitrate/sulfonate/bicarbonate transport system permease component
MTSAVMVQFSKTFDLRGRPSLSLLTRQIAFIVTLLLVWQLSAVEGKLGAIPTPLAVAGALAEQVLTGTLWEPLLHTVQAWALSLLLAVIIGLPVGFLLGASRTAYNVSVFVLDFSRTVPALALVPLAILLFGSGIGSTVLLAVFGCVWSIMLQTIYGVREVDPVARDTFRSYRVSRPSVVLKLVLPSAAPFIATGFRIAASVALLLTVSTEIVIPAPGMGEEIIVAQLGGATSKMYAYIFVCGLLGIAINWLFMRAERAVLAWHPSHRMGVQQ